MTDLSARPALSGPGEMSPDRPTLLVIEDTPDQALLVSAAAERARPGLEIRLASDGSEGIAYIEGLAPFEDRREHPYPDLVILDLYMPEVDGFAVLKWIQGRRDPRRFPVVILTSSIDPEDEARARELGAVAFHSKPSDIRELSTVVRQIVDEWIGASRMMAAHIWMAG